MRGWQGVVFLLCTAVPALGAGEMRLVGSNGDELGTLREDTDYVFFPVSPPSSFSLPLAVGVSRGCGTPLSFPFSWDGPAAVLIKRGGCTFQEKVSTASDEGAGAVLVYNDGEEPNHTGLARDAYIKDTHGIPVIFLTHEAGMLLRRLDGRAVVQLEGNVATECPWVHRPLEGGPPGMEVVHPTVLQDSNYTDIADRIPSDPASARLHEAISHRLEAVVQTVLAEVEGSVMLRDGEGRTPLHTAASGSCQLIPLLLASGADIDALDSKGRTPLYISVLYGWQLCTRMLLTNGANVELTGTVTPLYQACRISRTYCELLLAYGADPHNKGAGGESALMLSARTGKADRVDSMLRYGALQSAPPGMLEEVLEVANDHIKEVIAWHLKHEGPPNPLTLTDVVNLMSNGVLLVWSVAAATFLLTVPPQQHYLPAIASIYLLNLVVVRLRSGDILHVLIIGIVIQVHLHLPPDEKRGSERAEEGDCNHPHRAQIPETVRGRQGSPWATNGVVEGRPGSQEREKGEKWSEVFL